VVSHPFARKKAKGWGTVLVQNQTVKDLDVRRVEWIEFCERCLKPVDPAENPNAGEITRIGRYDIVGLLGRGGMGVVYRGIDKALGREVAIKTLTGPISSDPEMLARFYEEGRKTGSFKHPNIVTVYELGDHNGIPYIAMELVEGNPLDKLLQQGEPIAMVECLRIVEELCAALAYAHHNNVIHRDVKPANIFVQPDGRVKLLDFGIARLEERRSEDINLTRPGHIIGTLGYMAPERLRDKPVDGRSDIFAAGVVLYQLVCGQLPFSGEDSVVMQRIVNEPHAPLSSKCKDCPAALDAIVDRALAKSPDDRYSTAEDLGSDLSALIADIRQEEATQLLPEAKRLMEAQDLTRARAVLLQLLKVRTTHTTEARELLAGIQKQLSERQRGERIQQLLLQADALLNGGELEKSLTILDEGLEMDPANPELMKTRQRVEKEAEKQKRIGEFLRQAESARFQADYQAAIGFARKAIKADKSNVTASTLLNVLLKEAEEAVKQVEVKTLLQSATKELKSMRYREANEILRKAEILAPNNMELQLLLGDVNAGLEQARRRELVARLENDAASAVSLEQQKQAAQGIREALGIMPTESALVVLLGKIERRIQEQENRRYVDETLQACRDLRPRQALPLIQKARQSLPGDERLLALEGLLAERVRQQSVEERRDDYLIQAREAISNGLFANAVQILEGCQREGIASKEIEPLLEFARHEEAEQRRQDLLRSRVVQAQSLIGDSAFDEAIEFLEETLRQNDEPPFRLLLEQATAGLESLRKQVEAGLASAGRLVRAGKISEAIEFLQTLSPAVQRSVRVRTAESALREEQQQAVFRMVGRAYAVLETELPAGLSTIRWVVSAFGDSTFARSVADALNVRTQAFADRTILELISECRIKLRNRDRAGAGVLVKQASAIVSYAGAHTKSDWRSFMNQTAKAGLLTRMRNSQ
jgi:eukaryotic-like serine/threonine-protein kinase